MRSDLVKCPHLRESGRPLCLATPVVRIPNVVDLREYCLTAHGEMCPYYDSDDDRSDAPLSRTAS